MGVSVGDECNLDTNAKADYSAQKGSLVEMPTDVGDWVGCLISEIWTCDNVNVMKLSLGKSQTFRQNLETKLANFKDGYKIRALFLSVRWTLFVDQSNIIPVYI